MEPSPALAWIKNVWIKNPGSFAPTFANKCCYGATWLTKGACSIADLGLKLGREFRDEYSHGEKPPDQGIRRVLRRLRHVAGGDGVSVVLYFGAHERAGSLSVARLREAVSPFGLLAQSSFDADTLGSFGDLGPLFGRPGAGPHAYQLRREWAVHYGLLASSPRLLSGLGRLGRRSFQLGLRGGPRASGHRSASNESSFDRIRDVRLGSREFRGESIHSYRKCFGSVAWCRKDIAEAAREHWEYGKFPVAASFLSIGSSNMQTFLVAFSSGLGAAGVLRAMQNLGNARPADRLPRWACSSYPCCRVTSALDELYPRIGRPRLT